MAKSIRLTLECYDKGLPATETRRLIFEQNSDIGDGWFEAPSNVSYAVMGLLYGEGDFKKSMITAINCGDDTDCTGATVGATLGIMYGMAGIPDDWKQHIGDAIETVSVIKGVVTRTAFPKTCTDLTERILKTAPVVLFANNCDVTVTDKPTAIELPEEVLEKQTAAIGERFKSFRRYVTEHDVLFARATVDFGEPPVIREGEAKRIVLKLRNKVGALGRLPQTITLRSFSADGLELVDPVKTIMLAHTPQYYNFSTEVELFVKATAPTRPVNRLTLELEFEGRPSLQYIPVVFYS